MATKNTLKALIGEEGVAELVIPGTDAAKYYSDRTFRDKLPWLASGIVWVAADLPHGAEARTAAGRTIIAGEPDSDDSDCLLSNFTLVSAADGPRTIIEVGRYTFADREHRILGHVALGDEEPVYLGRDMMPDLNPAQVNELEQILAIAIDDIEWALT